MKKQLLTLFKNFLNSEVQAGRQSKEDAAVNYKDIARMNETRLLKMAKAFNLVQDSQFARIFTED